VKSEIAPRASLSKLKIKKNYMFWSHSFVYWVCRPTAETRDKASRRDDAACSTTYRHDGVFTCTHQALCEYLSEHTGGECRFKLCFRTQTSLLLTGDF